MGNENSIKGIIVFLLNSERCRIHKEMDFVGDFRVVSVVDWVLLVKVVLSRGGGLILAE